jgi:hypothetical protein
VYHHAHLHNLWTLEDISKHITWTGRPYLMKKIYDGQNWQEKQYHPLKWSFTEHRTEAYLK